MADALKVHDGDENVLIATASASGTGQTAIRLWEWKAPKKSTSKPSNGRTWSIAGTFEWFLKAVVVMAATAYFINVIREQITSSRTSSS